MASATYHRGVNLGGFDKLVEAVRGMGVHYNESDGFGWEIRKLREYRDAFFDACPVQPGDAVVLARPPEIPKNSGWYPSRLSFHPGAPATVHWIDWGHGRFIAAVSFDTELNVSDWGNERRYYWRRATDEEDRRHLFLTNAEWWDRAPASAPQHAPGDADQGAAPSNQPGASNAKHLDGQPADTEDRHNAARDSRKRS
jgi:hypothetical protein